MQLKATHDLAMSCYQPDARTTFDPYRADNIAIHCDLTDQFTVNG